LTPIVDRPEDAHLDDAVRSTLQRLSGSAFTAVISGRDLDDLCSRVGLPGLGYAGSHGIDIALPDGSRFAPPAAVGCRAALELAAAELRAALDGLPGALVEHKRYAVTAHDRLVEPHDRGRVEAAVDRVLDTSQGLRKRTGKHVFELIPDIDWDKGTAVQWLLERLPMRPERIVPIYVGDDTTDEDAFRRLPRHGIGIVVMEERRPTAARYRLTGPEEVAEWLDELARQP
jgi:trehalose-phosphatase